MTDHDLRRDDDRLAVRAREGDPRSLAMLYRRHAPALLGYLTRFLRDRAAAEDVLHDTFLRIFEGRGSWEARGRFRPWIFKVATRLATDRSRVNARREELLRDAVNRVDSSSSLAPDEAITLRQLERKIDDALADLPAAYTSTFHLRISESLTYKEIAEIRGEPVGTLRSRVHHAIRRIRAALSSDYKERTNE